MLASLENVASIGAAASAGEWLKRARRNLRASTAMLDSGLGDMAAFHAQQTAEFALKALQVYSVGKFTRTHDLTDLAKRAGAPPRIVKLCAALTPAYIAARYPDVKGTRITRSRAEAYVDTARRILRWARRQIP